MSNQPSYEEELLAAIGWWRKFLSEDDGKRGFRVLPTPEQVEAICASLEAQLRERFDGHWFPQEPLRGQAYRCVAFLAGILEPIAPRLLSPPIAYPCAPGRYRCCVSDGQTQCW